jgi:putative methionine-R-sulfoxide reductase with GAF domain
MLIHEIPIAMEVIRRTARNRQTQLVRDVSADPISCLVLVMSEVAVPLIKEDNVLGVLNIQSTAQGSWANDANLLDALAGLWRSPSICPPADRSG